MQINGHHSAQDARTELTRAGYLLGFSSPGRPALWALPGIKSGSFDHRAVQQQANGTWAIVPYPEPATVSQYRVSKHNSEGFDQ